MTASCHAATVRRLAMCLAVLALPAMASPAGAQTPGGTPSIRVSPERIEMGTFSNRFRVVIDGTVGAGAQAVIVVTGADAHETFNRKGRFGPIWISSGKVEVTGVPAVLLAFSAAPVDTFLRREAIDQDLLDETAVKRRMTVAPPEADEPLIRDHYVALKLGELTYRFASDAVRLERQPQGDVRYALDFAWPNTVPPGQYEATVYECRGGEVVSRATAGVEVREVGSAATVRQLAENRATVYGTLAVALMMSLGFGIDALVARFRQKRGRRNGRPGEPRAGRDLPVH